MVDSPVPKQGCGGRTQQAADGQRYPGGDTDVSEGRRLGLVVQRGTEHRTEEPGAQYPSSEHGGPGEDGVCRNDRWAVGLHQFFAKQYPGQGGDEGKDHHEIALERGLAMRAGATAAAQNNERRTDRGTAQGQPAEAVQAFTGKKDGRGSQQHRHRTHHERSMAYRGAGQAVELDEELHRNTERGGDEKQADFAACEADPVQQRYRNHAEACKKEAVEHHVLHAHFIERQPAEVEASAPEAPGQRAGAIAQEREALVSRGLISHPSLTVAYGRASSITARTQTNRRQYLSMVKQIAQACSRAVPDGEGRATEAPGRILARGCLLLVLIFPLACAPRSAPAQGSNTFANQQPRASKKHPLPDRLPDKPSIPPAFAIPMEPLGFTSPGAIYLGQRTTLVSLDFLDESRLLFTFRVPGLIRRDAPTSDRGDERQIRAVVLDLPAGVIESEAVWSVHDRSRYLWMLKDGQFLLRDREGLEQGNARLELKPFLQFPGPVLSVELDPTEQYLVTNSREPALAAQKPGDVPSPPTASANIAVDGVAADGRRTPAESETVVRILRRDTGQVMLVSRTRAPIHLAINSEGYLESIRSNATQWLLNLNFFTGGSRVLGRVESACSPAFNFVSQQELLATLCDRSGGRKLAAIATNGHHLWENATAGQPVWPLLVMAPNGSRLARETLVASHPISALAPLDGEDVKGQLVEVLNAADGQLALKVTASPVLDAGGNVAISPSGRRVAVLNAGAIQVFELPEPPSLPDAAR